MQRSDYELLRELFGGLVEAATPREDDEIDTAFHESGHALIAWYSSYVLSDITVTITPSGIRAGALYHRILESGTATQLYEQLLIALGGLAAVLRLKSKIRGKHFEDDLEAARRVAEQLAQEHPQTRLKRLGQGKALRFDLARMYRTEMPLRARAFMNDALEEARQRLEEHQEAFHRLARALLQRKYLDNRALHDLLGPRPWEPR